MRLFGESPGLSDITMFSSKLAKAPLVVDETTLTCPSSTLARSLTLGVLRVLCVHTGSIIKTSHSYSAAEVKSSQDEPAMCIACCLVGHLLNNGGSTQGFNPQAHIHSGFSLHLPVAELLSPFIVVCLSSGDRLLLPPLWGKAMTPMKWDRSLTD